MIGDPRLSHPLLRRLAGVLATTPGLPAEDDGAPARAAVALTLRPTAGEGAEILLIRRAERVGDPWSGQIALPGGRWSPNDESLLRTALRETWEETGIDLAATGIVLGTLDELRPRTATLPPIIVTPVVVALGDPPPLVLSEEVADAFWVSLDVLRDPALSRESPVQVRGATWRVPSFVVGEHVVWGMTERILRQLLSRLG
ncbi:MAG TPA: CoA pyrophosphatase [Gemmatimonadaceae bacterium]|nr:CoA pyrophosphatase [Gemmatimonadaceae bacterium]